MPSPQYSSISRVPNPDAVPVRLDTLTGLRFAAALMVFVSHTGPLLHDGGLAPASALGPLGFIGVSFFFLLSGFVLTWSASSQVAPRTFLRRRAARILPLYWVVLAVVIALLVLRQDPLQFGQAASSLLLVQSWIPELNYFWGVNSVAWTLSCEAFFYALAPWVLPLLIGLSPIATRRALVGLIAVVFAAAVALPSTTYESTNFWLNYIFPPMRMVEFMIGALLAREVLSGRWRGVRLGPSLAVAAVACMIAPLAPLSFSKASITLIPFMFVLAAAARVDSLKRPSWFRHPWWIALGMWSYAFYLVHLQVIEEVARAFGGAEAGLRLAVVIAAVAMVVSVVLAWMAHRAVERPAERALRDSTRPAAVIVVPPPALETEP